MNFQISKLENFHNQSRYHINKLLLSIVSCRSNSKDITFAIFKFIELLMYYYYPYYIGTSHATFFPLLYKHFHFVLDPANYVASLTHRLRILTNFCPKVLWKTTVHGYGCLTSVEKGLT